jgi:orotate phosphoribosyltransferase
MLEIGIVSVVKKGSSLLVTIPAQAARWMNLKAGDKVEVRYHPVNKQILIEKMTMPSLQEEEEILLILQETNAYFDKGHYILASGRHSDRYIFARLAAADKDKRLRIAHLIARRFENENINVVAAFTVGGALLGNEVAKLLNSKFVIGRKTEGREIEFENLFKIDQEDRILILDDVLTTGGSIKKAIEAIKTSGRGKIKGVAALVDRSENGIDFGKVKRVGLIKLDLKQYDPEACPLCSSGVEKVDLSHVEIDKEYALSVLTGERRDLMIRGFEEYEKLLEDACRESKRT